MDLVRKTASGWNHPLAPGRFFSSRTDANKAVEKRLRAQVEANKKLASDTDMEFEREVGAEAYNLFQALLDKVSNCGSTNCLTDEENKEYKRLADIYNEVESRMSKGWFPTPPA